MTLLTSSILSLEPLFDGLVSYFAPSWLLKPGTGWLRAVSYIAQTATGTSHPDATHRIPIMASGAWFLSMAAMQLLATNVLQKRAFLKSKLVNSVLLSMAFLGAAFANSHNSVLSPAMTGLKAGLQIGNILWIISDMIRYFSATKDSSQRTPLKPNQLMLLALHLMHGISSAIVMICRPEMFVGGLGWGLWRKMSSEQHAIDEITQFTSRIVGAFFLTSTFSILDMLISDRSVERFAWWNTQAVITHALHTLMYMRASTGADEMPFKRMILFNTLLTALSLKVGPTLFGELKNTMHMQGDEMKETEKTTTKGKTEGIFVPGLSDEGIHPKKSL